MHDTSVPNLSVWSGPAAPLCCLANKSQARLCSESLQSALEANLSGPGSMIYQTVWKPHTTPLGRQMYRRRASARRTSDSEHSLVPSGWMTPTTSDTRSYSETALMTWLEKKTTNGHGMDLNMTGQLSGWPTPEAEEARRGYQNRSNGKKGSQESMTTAVINALGDKPHLTPHGAARITADGTMLTGCSAGMESGGQLNPAFSAWLQGFPEAWCHAAISCQLPPRLRKAPKKAVA